MFKRIVVAVICLGLVFGIGQVASAEVYGEAKQIFSSSAVAGNGGTATSVAIPVKTSGYFGIWYKATSTAGTPDIKIEVLMSPDETDANFVEPENMPDVVTNLTAETAKVDSINPPPMKYMKIKCTGNASNNADTVVDAYLFIQSE